jgi:hypothetical protein
MTSSHHDVPPRQWLSLPRSFMPNRPPGPNWAEMAPALAEYHDAPLPMGHRQAECTGSIVTP